MNIIHISKSMNNMNKGYVIYDEAERGQKNTTAMFTSIEFRERRGLH